MALAYPNNPLQQNEISGTITDDKGVPIAGATILVKGTNRGTVSNFDGKYSIIAKPTDTLQISYLGYTTVTLPINNRISIDVILQEDATALGEVQINAGYYTTTDRERTGSIARITAKDIEKQPVNNPLAAMQGRMTGVDIVQTSGVPGSGFEVKIRGQNSIMAGNHPLYIIDGMPYNPISLGSSSSSIAILPNSNISPLNAINPTTIESIEVLKDADATAIYGSRGANGVVLITTKKGKKGKTKIVIDSRTGISNITKKRELLNTQQYLEMRREAFTNDRITVYPANAYDINGTWEQARYTDWQKLLIGGTANESQLQASVSGGGENTQMLLTGMYQNETTVFPGKFNYDRITVNANAQHGSIDKRFNLLFNVSYSSQSNQLPGTDLTSEAIRLPPNAPNLYDENGELNWENNTWTNPLGELQGKFINSSNDIIANAVLNYKVAEGVELKLNAGYSDTRYEDNNSVPHTKYNPAYGLKSNISQSYNHKTNRNSYSLEPQLNWTIKSNHHKWKIIAGATFENQKNETLTLMGIGFNNNSLIRNLSAAKNLSILNENSANYKYQSVFGRINYAFMNKLFLNATGRRDGSSRFGLGNRFGNFGALGAAWLFSEEINLAWLNYGKIRGSYGITGSDQIGDYQFLQTYNISDYVYDGNIGLQPARLYNPSFKWEENTKKEVALELGLFNQRISMLFAYYNNRSSNQLLNFALPATTGFNSIQANLDAIVENSGWEIELSGTVIKDQSFQWETSFNISIPKNKLLKFPDLEDSSYANRFVIGKPLTIFKLYNLIGVNSETGLFEFKDYNANDVISTPDDRQYIADLAAKFHGGFSNKLSYRNWNIDVFFQFVKKDGFNEFYRTSSAGRMLNQPTSVLDRWQKPGDQSLMQQFSTGINRATTLAHTQFTQSNGAISDLSFIRLKSMAISYTLPFERSNNTSYRISLQGQNLWTSTKFKGGDPEQDIGYLPPLRKISLQLQISL